jgi:hypothetical protein
MSQRKEKAIPLLPLPVAFAFSLPLPRSSLSSDTIENKEGRAMMGFLMEDFLTFHKKMNTNPLYNNEKNFFYFYISIFNL